MTFQSGRWLCELCDLAAALPQPKPEEKKKRARKGKLDIQKDSMIEDEIG